MVEWLEHHDYDRHDLGSKLTCIILLCLGEKHFTALFLAGGLAKQF